MARQVAGLLLRSPCREVGAFGLEGGKALGIFRCIDEGVAGTASGIALLASSIAASRNFRSSAGLMSSIGCRWGLMDSIGADESERTRRQSSPNSSCVRSQVFVSAVMQHAANA
jgi:hypothetical protein